MTKIQKIILGIVAGITVMLLFTVASMGGKANLGGTFNQVAQYFYQGFYAGTSNQFSVSNAGVVTTTGAITATGTVALGSASAGVNYYKPVVTNTADATLTVAQTGSIFKMGTAGLDLTLPAVASSNGVHYRFVVSGAVATTDMTVVSAEGDNIEGSLIVAGAVVDCDANDKITFVVDGENIGDFVDLFSDGTYWYIGASGGLTASKMTCSG